MMKTTGLFLCMTMLYSTICEAQSAPDSLQEQIQTITRNYSEGHTIFPLSNGFAVVKNKAIELQNRTKQTIPLRYGKRVANIRQRGSIALIEEPVQGSDLIHMRAYSLKQNKDVFEKLMHLRVTDFLNDHTLYTQALTLQDIRGTLEIINLEQGTKQTPDFLGKSPIFIAKAMDVHRLFILVEKRKQVDTKLGPMTQAAGTNFYVYNTIQQTIKDSGYLDGTHLISAVIPTIYEYNGQIYFILGDPKGDLKYVYRYHNKTIERITSKGGYYIVSFPTNKGPNMITRDKKTKQYYMTNLVTRESLLLNLNDVSRGGNLLVNIKKGHVESNGKVYVSVNHVYINNKNINGVISIDNKGHAILKKETLLLNNHIVNLTLK